VNYEKIQRKTEYILEKLKYLGKNRPENLERFIDDETLQMSILYAIHVSIEAIVDITIFIGTIIEEIYGNYDEILRDISYIIDGMTELITE
jgi:uncharacterized protein YutE (UPF0331/DUF86 family)